MEKMKIFATVLALSIPASYSYAAEGQGQVEFTGKLISETCKIEPGKETIAVTLPTLSTSTLDADGMTAGSTAFDISVVDCPTEITKVAAHFEAIGSSGGNAATGNLINSSTAAKKATDVEVRLYNSDEKQLLLGQTGSAFEVKNKKATLRYYGGYYATGATGAGEVKATAMYTLSYP